LEKLGPKCTFKHKLTTYHNFQKPYLFFSSTVIERNGQDSGILKPVKVTSICCLKKIDQINDSSVDRMTRTLDSPNWALTLETRKGF